MNMLLSGISELTSAGAVKPLLFVALTFVMHVISTLSYSVRLAGTKTGKMAISLSVWNMIYIFSTIAANMQAPMLGKTLDQAVLMHGKEYAVVVAERVFRAGLCSATVGVLFGTLILYTFYGGFCDVIEDFYHKKSMTRVLRFVVQPWGKKSIWSKIAFPQWGRLLIVMRSRHYSVYFIVLQVVATALWTTGGFATLLAGVKCDELVRTSANLTGAVNAVGTLLLMFAIDPMIASTADECACGARSIDYMKSLVVILVIGRLIGTVVAQILLVPLSDLIHKLSRLL